MSLVSWLIRKVVALKAPEDGLEREVYYLERALAKNQRRVDKLATNLTDYYCCVYCASPDLRELGDKIERQEERLEHLKKRLKKGEIYRYLKLERQMLKAMAQGDEALMDSLLDRMDPIWFQLSVKDRYWLNNRGVIG